MRSGKTNTEFKFGHPKARSSDCRLDPTPQENNFEGIRAFNEGTPSASSSVATISLSKRAKLVTEDGVVCPDALKSQITRAVRKLQRGFDAFEKNTGSAHHSNTKKLAQRATGADELAEMGALWQGSISVGTPAVIFTGSSDLFLPAFTCTRNCEGHNAYNTGASSTARNLGRNFSLEFGDGSTVSGNIFADTVTVAGLTAAQQAVGSSTRYSTGFSVDAFPPDGLMGMAFEQISNFASSPFFQTLVNQGRTTASEFGEKLATSGSELFLGGVNSNLFTGAFTQNAVTEVGFWQVNLTSVNVNGRAAVLGLSAIVDTGTTMIIGSRANVQAFYAAIPGSQDASNTIGAGLFTIPCNSIPSISLTFNGKAFPISVQTFNLGQVSAESSNCVGGIVAAEDLYNLWVVGDVFLMNVYTSFDVGNRRVGFADLA